uniref:Rho GTPase activating protein 23b n=1 Tax=Astyanax mexicanus TaxID=7994 RepID=A0A8B9H3X4_ASTMX
PLPLRDGVPSSNENARPLSGEGVAWKGPRTVVLQKNSQGFGFTLRHFIVYPPESALHTSLKDEENGNGKGNQRGRLEPMDTIFVKNVREKGPAHQAGLCTGDRLVKVNGESVLGKTYSQVINTFDFLSFSLLPFSALLPWTLLSSFNFSMFYNFFLCLSQAYSQDAYLKGNEPYTGGARNLPEPPPISYTRSKPATAGQPDNLNCRPIGPAVPLDNGTGGAGHRPDAPVRHVLGHHRARSSSSVGINPLDFHFANHNAAIASASLPHPRKNSLPQARSDLCHQALCDWYYSQAAERPGLPVSSRHRSVSQDRLAELGLALGGREGWPHSASQDTLLLHYGAAMGANHSDSYWLSRWGPPAASNRSCRGSIDDQTVGYRSYSPSFCRKAGHLMQQAHSFKDSSYAGPHLSWTSTPKSSPPDSSSTAASGRESSPLSVASTAETQDSKTSSGAGGAVEEPDQAQTQEVVLRQKPPIGRRAPHAMRHPNYSLPVDSPEHSAASAPAARQGEPASRTNGSLQALPVEQDSLASIPFIDEPTSPSVDLLAQHVSASSVVSSGLCQAPALSGRPESPSLTSPLTHLLHTDSSNVKNSRRSSYLLAITTERSKSCDEGLNTFREEGRVFSRLPKRVKSFFTDGSLESLRAAEEARSKRHSTSELGSITLTDIRKEGWLHYKQILTEKGKKVGGGMRPWKRVYSVLRTHSLFLYKDKREAVLHSAGSLGHGHSNQSEDEQPISIRGCLIDIAYSETKRKHTLRLTTQDFCEYLLQAEDRDDMLSWIRVIRENSKTDNEELGFSRQALINKKLNDYRKQSSPPKAPWSINIMKKGKKTGPKAFGVRLEDCPPGANNKFVPLIVEICCGLVEQMGLEYTGIYRVPGNNAMVSTLQDQLNKGMDINTAEERWQDLNVISSLLKSFFRKLPEPLFTDDKYNDFIDANRLEDAGDRLKTMRKLIRDLPDHYYHTLKFLIGHLKNVADNSEKNKMEPRNLALVFGPTLVRTSEDNMTDMVTHMPDRYKIVETLILHVSFICCVLTHLYTFSTLNSKKDVSAKDFLPLSIISAVTRKRKKHQSACPADSSSDEDSEHEPVKASNYRELGEGGGSDEGDGDAGCAPLNSENQTKEEVEENGGEQVMGSHEEAGQEVGGAEDAACQQEEEEDDDDGIQVDTGPRAQPHPRSFLYSHQSSIGIRATGSPASPSSSSCPSSAHRTGQTNPVTRKKLRGERVRPRSLYGEDVGMERAAVGLSWVKASLVRGQERLLQAMSPSRNPSVQQGWLGQMQANLLSSANDLWRSGAQRRHGSPETRRRRRDWRRHTVVGSVPGEG